jgi:hypothetical protein
MWIGPASQNVLVRASLTDQLRLASAPISLSAVAESDRRRLGKFIDLYHVDARS